MGITQALTTAASTVLTPPQGRLTLTTATPVMTADVTGATSIFYALDEGNQIPILGLMTTFTELTNATADSTTNPAAVSAYKNYDLFVWSNGGTPTLSRGPAWTRAQAVTISNATPAVISATAHGLKEGFPFFLTTDGALPTGFTAGTVYFVIAAGFGANSFQASATVGGAAVNTSSAGSGTHTCTDSNVVRGTGAGTTELQRANGVWSNKVAITNGPGANSGTYVGTVRSNASSQIDMIMGGAGAAGGESTFLGVWNAYNRKPTSLVNIDSTTSYTYSTATTRCKNGNFANRIQVVIGLQLDEIEARNHVVCKHSGTGNNMEVGLGINTSALNTSNTRGVQCYGHEPTNAVIFQQFATYNGIAALGYTQFFPLEKEGSGTATGTWYGSDLGSTFNQSAFIAKVMA